MRPARSRSTTVTTEEAARWVASARVLEGKAVRAEPTAQPRGNPRPSPIKDAIIRWLEEEL